MNAFENQVLFGQDFGKKNDYGLDPFEKIRWRNVIEIMCLLIGEERKM